MHENRDLYRAAGYTIAGIALGALATYVICIKAPRIFTTARNWLAGKEYFVHTYRFGTYISSRPYGYLDILTSHLSLAVYFTMPLTLSLVFLGEALKLVDDNYSNANQ